jgi:F0F1-type ATP synthase membrane subunit c/vacuolar-type H+-ATPase subunit K
MPPPNQLQFAFLQALAFEYCLQTSNFVGLLVGFGVAGTGLLVGDEVGDDVGLLVGFGVAGTGLLVGDEVGDAVGAFVPLPYLNSMDAVAGLVDKSIATAEIVRSTPVPPKLAMV